jgi:hypothetical protein
MDVKSDPTKIAVLALLPHHLVHLAHLPPMPVLLFVVGLALALQDHLDLVAAVLPQAQAVVLGSTHWDPFLL